ncbi:MAG: phage portal protein, partial [Planctomycetes bacterium]|nr:phage portal protein [Planctomycetota bacterium]
DLSGNHIKPDELRCHQDVAAGTVIYGNPNEKPHILESNRPGNTFPEFVERILRGIGVSVGMPYETVAKDFSKTNYSSARAALLEAWRVFGFYQKWLVDSFCQKVWEMVLEEAWLRGMITLPPGSPDWYDARHAYTRAFWIPPKKGDVDPLKTGRANELGLKNNTTTLADIAAESGQDVDAMLEQRAREIRKQKELGLMPEPSTEAEAKETDDLIAETELEEKQQEEGGHA